jgi:hypothetical protein
MVTQAGLLDLIRLAVENHAGRKIMSMADARWLAAELEHQRLFLSAHTIARFFRIISPERKIYQGSLNVLASYVGYTDWNHFCLKTDDVLPVSSEQNGNAKDWLSLIKLEIALQNQQWLRAVRILEDFESVPLSQKPIFEMISALVEAIRKWKAPDELMKALGKSPAGRKLYYEFAVDEDDHEGYFSQSLRRYYQPPEEEKAKVFFRESYLYAIEFYQNTRLTPAPPTSLLKDIDLSKLHFHEQSRWLEMCTIEANRENRLEVIYPELMKKAITLMASAEKEGKSWLPARIMMALFHLGKGALILEDKEALQQIRFYLFSSDFNIRHNADLVLQFVFCLAMKSGFLPEEAFQPMRQRQGIFWNQKARIALEFATNLCFFPNLKNSDDFVEYQKFCSENSQHWVLQAIQFRFKVA